MRFRSPAIVAVSLFAVLLSLAPTTGCGSKKRKPPTIAELLDRARTAGSDEAQAKELTRVARLQLRSGNKSGASKTLSEARSKLSPSKPRKPRPAPAAEEAAPVDGEAVVGEQKPEGEPAADGAAPAEATPAADGAAPAESAPPAEGAAADAAPAADGEAPAEGTTEPPAEGDAVAEPAAEEAVPEEPPRVINPVLAAPLLVDIAAVYSELGEKGAARDVIKQAIKMAPEIPDDISRSALFATAGGIYGVRQGGIGDAAAARRSLKEATSISGNVEERFRAQSLAAVAMGYVNAGLAKEASDMVATLEESARSVESPRARAEALAAAGNVRAQSGDKEKATELLGEAASTAKGIEGAENRTYALVAVADATSVNGDRKAALKLIAEAEKSANKVGDPDAQENAKAKVRAAKGEIERRKS
jgi:tetratricopeptide (TPR) repeat protein